MKELILKYNLLDALGKQEVMDFVEFIIQQRQKKMSIPISKTDIISKIDAMKMAANDPLYLQDLKEIQTDFEAIDHEIL